MVRLSCDAYVPAAGPQLFVSADERILIPARTSVDDVREAVRLFIGGFREAWRLRSYAYAARIQRPCVTGDVPRDDSCELAAVSVAVERAYTTGYPVAWRFDEGLCAERVGGIPVGRLHAVQSVTTDQLQLGSRSVWVSRARFALPNLLDSDRLARQGGSIHLHKDTSRLRAVGESVERFAAGDYGREEVTVDAADDLDASYVQPDHVLAFSKQQRERGVASRAFDPQEPNAWVRGQRVCTGEPVYVLAEQVYYPFWSPISGRAGLHSRANSSGVAAAPTALKAVVGAYREMVERHAFMKAWLSQYSPPRLQRTSMPPDCQDVLDGLTTDDWTIALFDLTAMLPSSKLAVVLAIAESRRALLLGCACGLPDESALRATLELVDGVANSPATDTGVTDRSQVRSPEDHRAFYRVEANRHGARFLGASRRTVPFSTLPRYEMDTPVPSDAVSVALSSSRTSPLHVARCVVPGLIPMSFGFDREPLGLPLAATMLRRSGRSPDLPLHPHPFA